MDDERVPELSNQLVVLSGRLIRLIRRHATVPPASLRVLGLLDELGPTTVGALAQADRCSQPTMTGLVNGLQERGWVARQPHPDDARSSLVSMTTAGCDALRSIRRDNARLVAERISAGNRSPEELAIAVAVLADLLDTD